MRTKKRDFIVLAAGAAIASLLISPAGAHVGGTIAHLWGHLKPKVTALVYTKTQSDARYLGKTAKAADSDKLDGKDSSQFAGLAEDWHEVGAGGEPAFNAGLLGGGFATHEACWWGNYDGADPHQTAAFYKDPFGVVHLKGLVKAHDGDSGAPMSAGPYPCGTFLERHQDHFIFALPAGYRPSVRVVFSTLGNAKPTRVNIDPDGIVSLGQETNSEQTFDDVQQWLTLDGLEFRVNN